MIRTILFTLSFLFITSCKSQEKENPKILGNKYGTFNLDRVTFKENKDFLLSKVKYVLGNINNKVNLYNIDKPETLLLKIGDLDVKFDYLQFWLNKKTNNFIFIESEAKSNETKNQEIIKNLEKSFKMIDLTDKERLKEDKKDKNTFIYHTSYLFKSANVYVYMETITFKDKKDKDNVSLNFYSYPFDKTLIESDQVSQKIINQ